LQVETPEKIVVMLKRLRQLRPHEGAAWGGYNADTRTVEFTAIVDQGHGRGVFSRLTGALTSQGLEILSAEINSLAGEAILDRFVVNDTDFAGPPPQERIATVCRALVHSLDSADPPKFRKLWGDDPRQSLRKLSHLSTEVKIDNNSSDTYTIIDVFTFDRTGLLYTIACQLVALRLSIGAARIGTYLDQVVDVFYVTDNQGRKIEEPARLEEIRGSLLAAIAGGAN
jgi:[protein-PII] uridylyltransferase